ncbi:MAG: Gfo/Idh/MocA family oxidoreductase [Planctomycetes bacterium]|nr:Gfo/Idh/MocA family oxidoreductase [Planctomycetota bacterium]
MNLLSSRRSFLKLGASAALVPLAACAGLPAAAPRRRVQGRLRHAGIGVGGMGAEDLKQISQHPEVDIVALCDVDEGRLRAAAERHPGAKLFRDWRELFRVMADEIDSVHVTTPDHMHAPIGLRALELGKHVYCQKPLTRTVSEARAMARAARSAGVVTQMGIQNRSNAPYRSAHELFRRRPVGDIYEVHVWTDRPNGWWPQGADRLPGADPIPAALDWDLWLGVAPERPYKEGQYHPFAWRGWLDFGTGAQGDMACHLMDPAVRFLELDAPTRLRSDGPTPNGETYPLWSTVHYEFPANRWTTRGPLQLTWHDGGRKAPQQLLDDLGIAEIPANGCLFVGTEGALFADPYSTAQLFPAAKFADYELPQVPALNHWFVWVDACRGEGEANASFDYAAKLTEVALLGNVALAFPHETLAWDGAGMRFPARPEADALLRPTYRAGWELA